MIARFRKGADRQGRMMVMTEAAAHKAENETKCRAPELAGLAKAASEVRGKATLPGRPAAQEREFGLRIGRDGTWYYRGSAIQRKELVCLFSSVLKREPDG